MKSCIYQILNTTNRMMYVGSAVNFNKRFELHRRLLRNNKHPNKYLQSAYNKYGQENFKFIILELCEKEKLLEKEQAWADMTQCYNREIGYNLKTIVNSNLGLKFSDETKAKMSKSAKGKIITQEFRDKMSRIRKGVRNTEEAKRKMSIAHSGKKCNHRNLDKWPHELGCKCKCEECKKTRNFRKNKIQYWEFVNV